jgi:hypothetical protein
MLPDALRRRIRGRDEEHECDRKRRFKPKLALSGIVGAECTERVTTEGRMVSNVDWSDLFRHTGGLDQLGMRLASEGQYTPLVDYATTVTWHPRYYSFLAWATREAFRAASDGQRVERNTWRRVVRELDYLVAASTLARSRETTAIIGSDTLIPRLRVAETSKELCPLGDDHVGDGVGTGSLEVYGGSMEALGLTTQKDGISAPTPVGSQLADAFEKCAKAAALANQPAAVGVEALAAIAQHCGLVHLNAFAGADPDVAAERDLLRERIVDWSQFDRPRIRRRVQSIAVTLRCHQLTGGNATLKHFREAILTGGIRGHGPLAMPSVFNEVLGYWRLYQVHAHVIFALESFLALGLQCLEARQPKRLVHRDSLIGDLLGLIRAGASTAGPVPNGLDRFGSKPLDQNLNTLAVHVSAGWDTEYVEPELDSRLRSRRRNTGRFKSPGAAAHDAALLFLCAIARLRNLRDEVTTGWLAQTARWRRGPLELIANVDGAAKNGVGTEDYLRHVIDELVLRQHTNNAYRKLAEQQGRATALFNVDGPNLELIDFHYAGTTNPRFDNATSYLQDLGYLSTTPYAVTADGVALLEQVTNRSGS